MRRFLLLGTLVALAPGLAAADVIILKAGGRIEGEVVEQRPDRVVIDVPAGRITLPSSIIEKTVVGSSSLAEFRARAARLADGDVNGWLALAAWAREHELVTQSRAAYERVLAMQPGNAAAHQALGHVYVDGHWMTRDDAYRARGFVQYEGNWVSPDERQAMVAERAAYAAEERERVEAEARIREAEARARTAEAEARRAEAAADASSYADEGIPLSYAYGGGGFGYGGYGFGAAITSPPIPLAPPPVVVVAPARPPRDNAHHRSHTPPSASTPPAPRRITEPMGTSRRH